MRPLLMGSETEYAVSGQSSSRAISSGTAHAFLAEALKKERAWMADASGGAAFYLENGSRFYMDYNEHPEYATPECSTPMQVAAYEKAGERLLRLSRERALREHPGLQLVIHKNNLSGVAPDQVTWGTHESYTAWIPLEPLSQALVPHLVSRIIYAGAGCLASNPQSNGFELSQRARHLVRLTGSATTSDRAIFCTRIRKSSDCSPGDGWTRVHLIGKDSQRLPFGTYLSFGVTGLLISLMNEGKLVGQGLQLADPLQALRAISCDPSLHTVVPLADGRRLTAVEIQRKYLEECENHARSGGLPGWAGEVMHHWRTTLDTLARDPLKLVDRLDAYCKFALFNHELQRAGCSWPAMRQAQADLAVLRVQAPPEILRSFLDGSFTDQASGQSPELKRLVVAHELGRPGRIENLRLAVRLWTLDLQFHEVGGWFDSLADKGNLAGHVISDAAIEEATRQPPPGGRAEVRGACIKEQRGRGWLCDWRYLYNKTNDVFIDLRSPFRPERLTTSWKKLKAQQTRDQEIEEIGLQLGLARSLRCDF